MNGAVLVLAKGFPPTTGGVEQYSLQVARAYLRAGYTPHIVTQTDGPVGQTFLDCPEGQLRVTNVGPGGQAITALRMTTAVRKIARRTQFEFVHSTTWRVGMIAQLALRRVSRIVTVHGREVLNFPRILGSGMRSVLKRADVVLCVSGITERVAREALGTSIPAGQWVTSYNGLTFAVEAAAYVPTEEHVGTVNVLSLSRLVARKNVEGTLRAIHALDDSTRQRVCFKIAGRGPDEERLRALVRSLALEEQVSFVGYVADDDVPALYQWADVFAHPHTHVGEGRDFEGFGIVIADGMSFGCACIVGDVGGPRELISDGKTGYLVDGESVSAIAKALHAAVIDEPGRRAMGQKAREHALREYSWDRHLQPAFVALDQSRDR